MANVDDEDVSPEIYLGTSAMAGMPSSAQGQRSQRPEDFSDPDWVEPSPCDP